MVFLKVLGSADAEADLVTIERGAELPSASVCDMSEIVTSSDQSATFYEVFGISWLK